MPIYEKGMTPWSIDQLGQDVRSGSLPQVSGRYHPCSGPAELCEITQKCLPPEMAAAPRAWDTSGERNSGEDHGRQLIAEEPRPFRLPISQFHVVLSHPARQILSNLSTT
jgi:hypothetical protein